jgi:hypothetical protein
MRTIALLALAALAALAPAPAALAQTPVTWLVPAGGETWTAGTTHTIEWSGGGPSVFAIVYVQQFPPYAQVPVQGNAFFPNNGHGTWTLSTDQNLLPLGNYRLLIGMQNDNTPYYSNEFTVAPAPECLSHCSQVWASFPVPSPFYSELPLGACGTSPHAAGSAAYAYIQSELAIQCNSGWTLDPNSLVIDVTSLPIGSCLRGYSGAYVAEASGTGCCCEDVVPARRATWGTLKTLYR